MHGNRCFSPTSANFRMWSGFEFQKWIQTSLYLAYIRFLSLLGFYSTLHCKNNAGHCSPLIVHLPPWTCRISKFISCLCIFMHWSGPGVTVVLPHTRLLKLLSFFFSFFHYFVLMWLSARGNLLILYVHCCGEEEKSIWEPSTATMVYCKV